MSDKINIHSQSCQRESVPPPDAWGPSIAESELISACVDGARIFKTRTRLSGDRSVQ